MHILMSPEFRRECAQYKLAFCCEECTYFRPEAGADEELCAIHYPARVHMRSVIERLDDGEQVMFCKMFESVERP